MCLWHWNNFSSLWDNCHSIWACCEANNNNNQRYSVRTGWSTHRRWIIWKEKTFLKRRYGINTKFEQYWYCENTFRALPQCSFSEPPRYGTTVTPYVTPGPGGNRQERLISSKVENWWWWMYGTRKWKMTVQRKLFSFFNLWTFTDMFWITRNQILGHFPCVPSDVLWNV